MPVTRTDALERRRKLRICYVIRYVQGRFADSPVLVVTARADAVGEADALGANAIIAKPFDVDVLLAKLDELLS